MASYRNIHKQMFAFRDLVDIDDSACLCGFPFLITALSRRHPLTASFTDARSLRFWTACFLFVFIGLYVKGKFKVHASAAYTCDRAGRVCVSVVFCSCSVEQNQVRSVFTRNRYDVNPECRSVANTTHAFQHVCKWCSHVYMLIPHRRDGREWTAATVPSKSVALHVTAIRRAATAWEMQTCVSLRSFNGRALN